MCSKPVYPIKEVNNVSELNFRNATSEDLNSIMKIEKKGFSISEASSDNAMKERIELLNDSFLVAIYKNQIVGFIVGTSSEKRYIEDSLYEKSIPNKNSDNYLLILSIAVDPSYQKRSIGSYLLNHLEQDVKDKRSAISLTCLKALIPFYEKTGTKMKDYQIHNMQMNHGKT